MVKKSYFIIVMTRSAASILKIQYGIADKKIKIIPHETHLVQPSDQKN